MKGHASGVGPLIGIAEVHDLSFAHETLPLARLLSGEAELAPDLRRPRPWLPGTLDAEATLNALLDQEWTGFVARLGQVGPWVYVPTVADLQALSGAYTRVAQAAAGADLRSIVPGSLLARLAEVLPGIARGTASAREAEDEFWRLAGELAASRRAEWGAGRP